MFGLIQKSKETMANGDHPEEDDSEILNDTYHCKYQMFIGILVWIITIGRFDVTFDTSSLSQFVACPRMVKLKRVIHIVSYLKHVKNHKKTKNNFRVKRSNIY